MIQRSDRALSPRWSNVRKERLRELFGFSSYAFLASLGVRLITRIDSIVIARVLTVALVTPFSIGARLMDYFASLFSGIHGPLLSSMSELEGRSRKDESQALFLRSSRFTLLLSFLLGSLVVFDGQSFLMLWLGRSGIDLNLTYRVLVILTACYVASYAQLPAWTLIYARARHQLLAWMVLGEGAANLGLSIYWGRRYGLVGIAMGTAVPAVVHHIFVIPFYALHVMDLPIARYFRESLWRPLLASILLMGFCSLTRTSSGSIIHLGLAAISQLVCFSILAYFLGIANDDRKVIRLRFQKWFSGSVQVEEHAK
jgi:O-antigen/teichoic acid export membrane protein